MQALSERERGPRSVRLGSLVRPPLTCPARATVAEAAALMTREGTSWVLVHRSRGYSIVTEQELTAQVLAAGRSPQTAIGEVVTQHTAAVPSDQRAADVLLLMLGSGLRHMPVADAHGQIIGVVSDTDLLGVPWRVPLALRTRIGSALDEGTVIAAGRELPRAVVALMDAEVDPVDVGRTVTLVIDVMTRRLLELAVDRLGTPPVSWAWLTLGSAARREQAIVSDQDHALAFDLQTEPLEEVDGYFLELAKAVTSGLDAAGIPRCRADVVAENRSLRRPLEHWVTAFNDWMNYPRLTSARQASILFDYRRSAGPLEAERTLDPIVCSAAYRPRFVHRLARQAMDARPPAVRLRRFKVERRGDNAGTFDVKHSGLTPIVNLARSYAVEAGITERATLDRLARAAEGGRISEQVRSDLAEAFRLMWRIRLEHQVRCLENGDLVDDFVDPRTIGALSRVQLKQAFRIVRHAQGALRREHGLHPAEPS